MPQYEALYPKGTKVRVRKAELLSAFRARWKYHHKLTDEMVRNAGRETVVLEVGYYHGGDPLYVLDGVPGTWHEECLEGA